MQQLGSSLFGRNIKNEKPSLKKDGFKLKTASWKKNVPARIAAVNALNHEREGFS